MTRSAAVTVDEVPARSTATTAVRWWRRAGFRAGLVYALISLGVMVKLLHNPNNRVLAANPSDQGFYEWMLALGAHHWPTLFTDALNVPHGVNLMANPSALGLAIPLAPVTYLLGAPATFALATAACLAATAFGWYRLLSRLVVRSRLAAAIGGGFAGFAPGMVSQATGHLDMVAQFLVPLLVWQVLRLCTGRRVVRDGLILGVLITWQAFIAEPTLVVTGLGLACFLGTVAILKPARRRAAAPLVRGLLVALGVAAVLLAYPLWVQFFGPQHYRGGLPLAHTSADIAAYGSFASNTVVRAPLGSLPYGRVGEENAYFGWPLLALVVVLVGWLRRELLVRAMAVAGVVLALLSLGPAVHLFGHHLPVPGPWRLVEHVPVLGLMQPGRFALGVIPLVGVLLAVATDRMGELRAEVPGVPLRAAWYGLLLAVLLPILPTPLAVTGDSTPEFITSGEWRSYVPPGSTLVPVPLPTATRTSSMRWAARADIGFALPQGYFLGPTSASDATVHLGAVPRPTSVLLARVAQLRVPATVSAADRARAIDDLRYWRAAVVVLPGGPESGTSVGDTEGALWITLKDLLGASPTWVDGVWVWDVRAKVSS